MITGRRFLFLLMMAGRPAVPSLMNLPTVLDFSRVDSVLFSEHTVKIFNNIFIVVLTWFETKDRKIKNVAQSVAEGSHNNLTIHTILVDMTSLAILILALLRQVVAVTVGHEQYGNIPGYFYIFAGSGISIVDPITGTVNKTIASTVTAYGDAVYLEDQAQLRHYVYAARSDENKMVVLDADTQTILTVVSVGQKPLHVYSLYYHDEVRIFPRHDMI
jgi:hypothetical protein